MDDQRITIDKDGFINITDSGIMHLAGAKSLTFLSLSDSQPLIFICPLILSLYASVDLENFVELFLDRTLITDAGIVYLDGLHELTHLSLNKTRIKNAHCLQSVNLHLQLKYPHVGYTRVADKGARELRGKYHIFSTHVRLSH
ncbi:hypothetical protein C2G38_2246781 [Gigaspora rosea]|uniref:Uncharacterized protein n=1 Tax=Gigaspora rosea TaxID=44941 RepID=A0A397V4H3_9GLOM|nr:hypothetical protein C2G38_2246781 [Gigaspora rosea]